MRSASCGGEPLAHSSHSKGTTEENCAEQEGQNVEGRDVSRPCFLGSCTDGPLRQCADCGGEETASHPDHCGRCIDLTPRFFFSVPAPFTPLCLLALSDSPVLRNPL